MLTKFDIARKNDHSLLKPQLTYADIKSGVEFAKETKCRTVCVTPNRVQMAYDILKGSETAVCSVVGFPNGCELTESKVADTIRVYNMGATEVDIVLNVTALKSGDYEAVYNDVKAVVDCSPANIKVILENCLLTKDEIAKASRIISDAKAGFVKTSTGFSTGGATLEDIAIMRENIDLSRVQVKAAGGLSTLQDCEDFIAAGCDRLGISRTKAIFDEVDARDAALAAEAE